MTKRHTHRPKSAWPRLLFLLGLGLIFFSGGKIWQEWRSSIFFGRNWRTSVVLATQPVTVVSLPKKPEEKIILLTLPQDAYMTVPSGYGKYRLEAVWRLSELEGRSDLFAQTVANLLGLPVAGWVNTTPTLDLSTKENGGLVSRLKQNVRTILLGRQTRSNLNFWDKVYLNLLFWSARPDRFLTLDVADDETIFRDTEIPGQIRVKTTTEEILRELIGQKFVDEEIRRSELSLEVRNTTGISGLGQSLSRFLTQIGGKVISVTNENQPVTDCDVSVKEKDKEAKIVRFLQVEFGCTVTYGEVTGSDVAIYVGETLGKRLSSFSD